ncbi:hypothetical protein GI374_16695 [Paracoccus sp. S-4012]|uniref:hypothetical protein n=1 Tax=Paracoccus sp. S-4012 TaxID=2665648 RepID=UPI0012AF1C03|nr:hypothetical protein [Paracoccus sp. S-4012]MRX52018.1 hypothetical protein [Paracoccus sp. S-4012]
MERSPKPFLVLTLRRTGGTSLVDFMYRVTPFPAAEDEPFNRRRVWGKVTTRYESDGNTTNLDASVDGLLHERPNIKHCLDIVPAGITSSLIDACARRGYEIFLLTRRNEVDRLVSLALAEATDVWGVAEAKQIYPQILAGEISVPPISVDQYIRRARLDAAKLGTTVRLLRHRRVHYQWLVFEELYQSDLDIRTFAAKIAGKLGVEIQSDDPRLLSFVSGSGQGSRSIEAKVGNTDILRERLERSVVC